MHRPSRCSLAARSVPRSLFCLRGSSRKADDKILAKAYIENWILITNDKGFGEMVCREKRPNHGVVFLRLRDERAVSKIDAIEKLLAGYKDQLADAFVVVTETQVRFSQV